MTRRMLVPSLLLALGMLLLPSRWVVAQVVPPIGPPVIGGVCINPDGVVAFRQKEADAELTRLRELARHGATGAKGEKLAFISLPKAFANAREAIAAGKSIPESARYLGGITQLHYVLVYPREKDILIAGPAEPIDASNPAQPLGKLTGRPILQLDDLVVAMRSASRAGQVFGCSIDLPPDAMKKAEEVYRRVGARAQQQLVEETAKAIGPQTISVFGVPPDTRMAMVCVVADYRLKRLTLGIDPPPVPGLSHGIDSTRPAGNRYWFEASYDPILMGADGNAFELRGPRLALKAGELQFQEKGATQTAINFARQFTARLPQIAAAAPIFADLQNIADVTMLAGLIHHDRLDRRIGWDAAWAMDAAAYRVPIMPTPKTADTLVCIRSGSLAAGGVSIGVDPWLKDSAREKDAKGMLTPIREQGGKARAQQP